jgi:hypothetical protein
MNVVSKSLSTVGAVTGLIALTPGFAWAITPYQASAGIPDATTCPNSQCQFTYPTVPAGMRLLVTSVSAQVGQYGGPVLEGGSVPYFVTETNPTAGTLNSPVTLFYEAGQTPTARIFAPSGGAHTSLIVTIVGELSSQ